MQSSAIKPTLLLPLCIVCSVPNQQQVELFEGPLKKKNILIIQTQHKSYRESITPTSLSDHFVWDIVSLSLVNECIEMHGVKEIVI